MNLVDAMKQANEYFRQIGEPCYVMRDKVSGALTIGTLRLVMTSPEYDVVPLEGLKGYSPAQISKAQGGTKC